MVDRRVVVTGVGLVSPVGIGTEETWKSLQAGRSGAGPITLFDASQHSTRFACEVKGFDPLNWVEKKDVKKMDRFIQFAVAAADFALADSGLKIDAGNNEMVGVYVGSGIGGFATIEREHTILMERGPSRISPVLHPGRDRESGLGVDLHPLGGEGTQLRHLHRLHHFRPRHRRLLPPHPARRRRRHDRGGQRGRHHSARHGRVLRPCERLSRAMTTRRRRRVPSTRSRDGFVIGEGSGVVILEELEMARRRGAHIYCELVGYGMSSDAYHISAPCEDGDGAYRVMNKAIKDARIEPSAIGYINVHGTSTPQGDKVEVIAIKRVFGDHARQLPISSTKSMTGHLLGAAGGLEAGITALALRDQILPPTINYQTPDPGMRPRHRPERGPACEAGVRAVELVRLRRHERRPGLQAL